MGTPARAHAKTVLVLVAHPDDEAILAAGRARAAVTSGDTVKLVIATNGDFNGVQDGYNREQEAVHSAQVLGLTEQDVVFLGYPDGSLREILDSPSDTTVITSHAGLTATYGNAGLGGRDYHRYLYGVAGPYNRRTLMQDLAALLTNFAPDEIYTHSAFEDHYDHQAVALSLADAVVAQRRAGVLHPLRVYRGVVWMPGNAYPWPQVTSDGWTPQLPILPWSSPCAPGGCLDGTQLEWSRALRFLQPPEMLLADPWSNLKSLTYPVMHTPGWYQGWTRRDEFFWLEDFGANVALTAQVAASSEDSAGGHAAARAIDGVVGGVPAEPSREWATLNELGGAWIELRWTSPVRIAQVNLHDRPNGIDRILSGTLTFSDGSSIPVGALPVKARTLPVTFAPKTVSWVRFTVGGATGNAVGLAEIEVLGAPAASTTNLPPHFVEGPTPALDAILASRSTSVSVLAHDLDGDALQYAWSVDRGWIQGSGPTAVFTPPPVAADTYVAVSVTIQDGRGGSATNSTFVRVSPAPTDDFTITPSAVLAGDSARGTVALASAAPAGGTAVPLSSDAPAVSVPASVTIPGGSTTAWFDVTTAPVSSATPATVSAAFPSGTRSASVTVVPRSVALTLSPSGVLGGTSAQGTVTLPAAAGAAGAVVQLASSDPLRATVPATVTVAASATTATFPIQTTSVASPAQVSISATFGTTSTATLTVSPLAVSTFALAPDQVTGGTSSQATVLLNGPAPASGAVVALTTSDPVLAPAPTTLPIPGGADRASFTIATPTVAAQSTATLRASLGGVTVSAVLTVTPYAPSPNLLTSPDQIGLSPPWEIMGGAAIDVTLNAAVAPDGTQHATRVTTVANAGHALRQVVDGLTPGATYTFSFYARNDGGSGASYSVYDMTSYAELIRPTPYVSQLSGTSWTRILVPFTVPAGCTSVGVYPLRDSGPAAGVLLWGARLDAGNVTPPADSFTLAPAAVFGGDPAQGTVVLGTAASSSGVLVLLASSDPATASVPSSVTVAGGATTATFPISTTDGAAGAVTITATFPSGSRTASLAVAQRALARLSVIPTDVPAGTTAQASVTLTAAAGPQGATVALASSDPATATVPASVVVPAGADTTTFQITTAPVSSATPVTITATYGTTVAAAISVSPDVANPNLLASPERIGAPPWETMGSVAVALDAAPAPDGSAHATRATVSAGGHAIAQPVAVSAGTTYTFSFYAQNDGGSAASYSVYDVTHGADLVAATSYVSSLSGSSFTRVAVTFTTPAGCASINVYPLRDSGSPVSVLLWGAKLELGTRATAFQPLGVAALAVAPSTIASGGAATGTVTLTAPADAGGASIALSSSDPAAASVPATVVLGAGAQSATFTVTGGSVAAQRDVTLSATYGASARTAPLTVAPPSVVSLTLAPASVTGGSTSRATVALTAPAPAGGLPVQLSSSAPAATVPPSVTVPAGATSVGFDVVTVPVATATTAVLTATVGGSTTSVSLAIAPPAVSSVALSPTSVLGGASATGTVTLSGAAPSTGFTVALTSSAPAATVPASVIVAAGGTTATFQVATTTVSTTTSATVSASASGVTRPATLTITAGPAPTLSSIALAPTAIVSGGTAAGTVTLSAPAGAAGVSVTLTSNRAAALVPATVTVSPGATTATFNVATSALTSATTATISATLGATTRSATLGLRTLALSVSPSTLAGGMPSTGTVRLSASVSTSVVVALQSSSASAVVPASVTIAAGATTATFPITTSAVTATTSVTISATYGTNTRNATLSLQAIAVSALALNPNGVTGGTPSTGTVTLNYAALAGGYTVTLADNGAAASCPASVVVPAGSRTQTFQVTTTRVTTRTRVSVSASGGGVTRSANLTINP